MRTRNLAFFALLAVMFVSPAAAEGNAAAGYELAKQNCARCHNIERDGAFKQRPPTFQAVAIYRTREDIWSRIIAPSPHSGMPDVSWSLMPDQVQDLVAYIVSLDRPVTLGQ
jgi:mono/diheme cytochrome c family protein